MNTIGLRLRAERERLGMNQTDFAALGGVQRRAQANYEADERLPDAGYLAAVAAVGVDLLYVVTGLRGMQPAPGPALRDGEATLLEGYRALDARGRMGVQALISGMAPHASGMNMQVSGNGSQVVGHISGGSVVIGHPAPVRQRAKAAKN